jgi:hypothetical protein
MSDDIPPPLIPDPPPDRDDTIFIPFLLADAPRLQLEFLARNSTLSLHQRESIRDWLRGYNSRLVRWIHDNYGPEAVRAADALSRNSAQQMNRNRLVAQDRAERDLFASLEEQMGMDDE